MHLQYLTPQTQEALLRAPKEAYSLAVAITAGFSMTIPTAIVDNVDQYLHGATEEAILRVVGVFNEARPVNIDETVAIAIQVWRSRYEVAHGLILETVGACAANSPLDLFGIGFCLTPEVTKRMSDNAAAIMPVLGACIKAARQITANPQA